jgi:uncharacterized membrane protein
MPLTYFNKFYMDKKLILNWILPPKRLRILIIILLVLGIFFRFANIDRKLYWCDEVYTSLRMSGYLQQEMDRQLRDGHLISPSDLQKYQYPNPSKNTLDTINGLIAEESQLSPLYFVLVRWWVERFGNSIAIVRSLSALISLLTFPALYWLCRELFESRLVGWMAISLVAVSPVHIVYAQEARPYSLSIVAVLVSSAALLRAIKLQTRMSWAVYAATLTLGLYTQLFFGFVIIAQSIYVVVSERLRLTEKLINYMIAVGLGILTFMPWVSIFLTHPTPGNLTWVNTQQTLAEIAIRWIGIISRAFADFGIGPNDTLALKIAVMPLVIMVFILIIYAVYFLCRQTPKPVWLFAVTLIGSICLPLMFLDFGLGKRYGTTRYILPSTIGMQLAVAYLLSTKIMVVDHRQWQQKIWSAIVCGLITIEVISCTISSQSQMWWNKVPELYQEYPNIATMINKADRPLVITDADVTSVQILGHLVDHKMRFQVVNNLQTIEAKTDFSDVFIFVESKSSKLKANVEKAYNSRAMRLNDLFWQIKKSI